MSEMMTLTMYVHNGFKLRIVYVLTLNGSVSCSSLYSDISSDFLGNVPTTNDWRVEGLLQL